MAASPTSSAGNGTPTNENANENATWASRKLVMPSRKSRFRCDSRNTSPTQLSTSAARITRP
jgi:hypothetical protein